MTAGERPLFVTFEGGEGSGKTTQIAKARAFLAARGRSVVVTREPGGSPKAEALREALLSGAARDGGPELEAALFAAARADHVASLIRPALARGSDVLCDRFHDSTRVYQGLAGVDAAFLTLLEDAALDDLRPDLTIVLDLPAADGLARAASRRGAATADRFEGEAVEIHETRRRRFLEIAAADPKRCRVVDASRPADEVAREVARILGDKLGEVIGQRSSEPVA